MQMLKDNQNIQQYKGNKSIKTEGNFDERGRRDEQNFYERNLTQQNESPIRVQQQINGQRSGRSISLLNSKSQQNTQREDALGSLHSPNFAQNLEQISQRFESFKNGGSIIKENLMNDQQNINSSQNLRQSIEQKIASAQNIQNQTMQMQQQNLFHSRSSSFNSNYSTSYNTNLSQSNQNNINRKKIFENALPPPPLRSSIQNAQQLSNKGKPQNSNRAHQNSSNKENVNKNLPNTIFNTQFDEYNSITSNSNKEINLDKANEKIQYLEQNLHKEILNSEEQRSQISILKNELERKMIDNGFMNFFKTTNSSHNLSHIDIYMELQVIKQKLLEKEEKIQALSNVSNTIELQDIKERNKQLELQNENFRESLELLRFDRRDLEDLKAEKQNLIEFVEKIKSENEKLEEDVANLQQKANNLTHPNEYQELKEQIDYLIEENTSKDHEIESLSESVTQINLLKEQIEKHRQNLIEQNKQLNQQIQVQNTKIEDVEQEFNNTQKQLEQYQQQNDELQEQIQSLKSEMEDNNDQFASKVEEFEKIIEQINSENQILLDNDNKQQQEINNYKEQIQTLKMSAQSNTFIQNQFESYQQKFEDAKDNIYTLTQTLEETNTELEKIQTKCTNFEQIAKEKNTLLVQKEDQIKQFNEQIQTLEKENEFLKRKMQDDAKESRDKQAQLFYSEKRNLSLQLEHQKSQNIILEKKIQELEKRQYTQYYEQFIKF